MKARSTAPGAAPPAHPALAEAAEWTALLRSGTASPEDLAAFETWRSSSREHEAAAATLARMLAPLDRLREQGIGKTLREETLLRARRRQSRRSFVLSVGAGIGVGVVGWNAARDMGLTADRHTGLAQRSQAPLPDGSTLWMDARTSADIAFDAGHRSVVLRQGRVLAEAKAGGAPFTVQGPQSTLQTQGGKFVIQTNGQQMLMVALQGTAAVAPVSGAALSLEAGQRVTLGEGAPAGALDPRAGRPGQRTAARPHRRPPTLPGRRAAGRARGGRPARQRALLAGRHRPHAAGPAGHAAGPRQRPHALLGHRRPGLSARA